MTTKAVAGRVRCVESAVGHTRVASVVTHLVGTLEGASAVGTGA